jgi:hypothetical protein
MQFDAVLHFDETPAIQPLDYSAELARSCQLSRPSIDELSQIERIALRIVTVAVVEEHMHHTCFFR